MNKLIVADACKCLIAVLALPPKEHMSNARWRPLLPQMILRIDQLRRRIQTLAHVCTADTCTHESRFSFILYLLVFQTQDHAFSFLLRVNAHNLLQTMNSAGKETPRSLASANRGISSTLALSLAASMFEGSGADNDSLADTDTQLYVLGIKYKTPNGS